MRSAQFTPLQASDGVYLVYRNKDSDEKLDISVRSFLEERYYSKLPLTTSGPVWDVDQGLSMTRMFPQLTFIGVRLAICATNQTFPRVLKR